LYWQGRRPGSAELIDAVEEPQDLRAGAQVKPGALTIDAG
jgi:hypothetical protein